MDLDSGALRYGEGLAGRRDLDGYVRYVCGNVLCADALPAGQDVVVLSGSLDYFDSRIAVTVLGNVHKRLMPGGVVLLANMRRHHLAVTMSILGNWRLVCREPAELERLLTESGYREVRVWLEPEKVFCVGRGTKPRQSVMAWCGSSLADSSPPMVAGTASSCVGVHEPS